MYRFWISVSGTGYCPFAPGTCGSAVAAMVFAAVAFAGGSGALLAGAMLLLAAVGLVTTVVYGDRAIARYGPDPRQIVSDELCGQALTYLWLWPLADYSNAQILVVALAGFVLFRVFDILKPPPIRQLEKLPGAWGVLLDDVLAGIYAAVVLQLLCWLRWLPLFTNGNL